VNANRTWSQRVVGSLRRRRQVSPEPDAVARTPRKEPPRTAILIVNGFDRRGRWGEYNEDEAKQFPWIDLCLRQIDRFSRGSSYEVLVWDNSFLPEQEQLLKQHPRVRRFKPRNREEHVGHGPSLDRLLRKVHPETEFVVTLDTDSFPVRHGWIENLTGRLTGNTLLAGVWRDELVPKKAPFIHPCGLAVRRDTLLRVGLSFRPVDGLDVGQAIDAAIGRLGSRSRLRRSNVWNPHFLMGAIYGDLIYHQGAGSRNPQFQGRRATDASEAMRESLRDAAFNDVDALVAALSGNADTSVVPEVVKAEALQG
jgi:hypothetical protein